MSQVSTLVPKDFPMTSEKFQRTFLLLLAGFISVVFLWMVRDYVITIIFAAIFAALMRPLYLRFVRWTKGRAHLSSALALLVFVILIVLPVAGFVVVVANQAAHVAENVTPWVQEHLGTKRDIDESLRMIPGFKHVAAYREPVLQKVSGWVSGLGNMVFKTASTATAGTLIFFVKFAIMLYAMFFFFVDGPAILKRILYYTPLPNRDEEKLMGGFLSMARATIKGLVVIGVLQGGLAALALWAAGLPSALFWGTLMAVLSIVPNVGSALVWLPACVYLFLTGHVGAGVGVFLWCALVVGSADNVLRPVLVGKDTKVHELLVLLSTLGGLAMLGLEGFILGPMIAVVFLTVWDIYGVAFKDVLPKPRGFDDRP